MTAADQQQDLSEREADANALATYADRVIVLEGEVASLTQTLTMRSAALDRVTATNGTATARVRELEAEVERLRVSDTVHRYCISWMASGNTPEQLVASLVVGSEQTLARAESAEAERDALQQRLANVQALLICKCGCGGPASAVQTSDLRAALGGSAVSSRPGMTVTEAVADALADRSENTGQITGGTPQELQPAPEAKGWCVDHGMHRSECPKWNHPSAGQPEPVERITDANGDELERGADTDAQTAQQQDGSDR